MAKKDNRGLIKLRSSESGHVYYTQKNKKNDPQRLELKKFDPIVRRKVTYKEAK